ncbi:hypothetical protein M758_9G148700 [Ceratodon purpureus]|nr:hypothetical protein M758_9G148700 [Ceratodon purpureus]
MTSIQRDPNSTLDSSNCSQNDKSFQIPNISSSSGEMRTNVAGNHSLENRAGSAPEVHIQVTKDWNSSLGMSKSERRPAYMLTPQTSRLGVNGEEQPASSGRRFSSQTYSELFGSRLQTEPKESQNRAANNQASYDKFRTRSARFDRQSSTAVRGSSMQGQEGRVAETSQSDAEENEDCDSPSAIKPGRYFDALHGPELDELRDHEVLMLPKDELWPFLLRFPLNSFGVCLGLGSQTILWKRLHLSPELGFLNIPKEINLFLWSIALLALIVISTTYLMKVLFYFEAVRREYFHPVRINFFFAPWIAAMFLAIGLPPSINHSVHPAVFCCFMSPIFILELKLYGQWLSGGKRRLSKVANPSTHLSIVGNFVGSLLAAIINWKEVAIFFWSVGLAHYLVLFVTLYQRLPTNEKLPKDLHPVFFLFVAAPSTASVAWQFITGGFDYVSRVVFFIALFLYTSLVVRINFFRGIRFTLSWWAYTFPMTGAAIAAIEYLHATPSWITRILAMVLSAVSSCTVFALFITTLLHAVVWKTLFQNDNAIAITARGTKMFSFRKATALALSTDVFTLENEPLHKIVRHHLHHLLSKEGRESKQKHLQVQVPVSISASERSAPHLDDGDSHAGSLPRDLSLGSKV